MWKWLILTGLIAAQLQGSSGGPIAEDDEADRNHISLPYVFDKLVQQHMQSEDAAADENILSKRGARRKPVITSTAVDFTVKEGEDVSLPCKVNNLGRSYVVWKKDGTDIIKVKKIGRQWRIPRRYSSLHIDTGDMSMDETSLTLHGVDVDDQGKYSCNVEGKDTQVEHTVRIEDLKTVTTAKPSDKEDDYYDYDYYKNYENPIGKGDEDEPENKEDKEEDKSSVPSTIVEEKSSSKEDESDDDYYDYYEGLFDDNGKEETGVEDPEEIENEETLTTETPTEAPTPEHENKEDYEEDKVSVPSTNVEEESSSSEEESDEDYYDYYEDLYGGTDKEETGVEDPEEVKNEETSTTETPTEAPTPEPDNKEYKEEDKFAVPSTNVEEESSSNQEESDDDYYDYYEDLFDTTDKEDTGVEDSEGVENEETPTTETPTEAPTPEPTKPAYSWWWSWLSWGKGQTNTTETPTTTERVTEGDDHEFSTPETTKLAHTWSFWGKGQTTTTETPTTTEGITEDLETVTTAKPSDNEDDYYDYDYYENYENPFDKDDEDEPENKEDKEEDTSSVPSTIVEEESSSKEDESDDDYYDYYEGTFDDNGKEEIGVEDPEEVENEETTTTETPTEAPTQEPTKPARTWGWSYWSSKPETTVQTTTTETPTTESVSEGEDDEYSYGSDYYDYGVEEDKEDKDNEDNVIEKEDDKNHDDETFNEDEQEDDDYEADGDGYKTDKDDNLAAEASHVAVGKDGMALLTCTLSLAEDHDDDDEQEHVEWRHNNVTVTPDGESIVSLRDGDMHTLVITSVRREDLGEYRCIIGEKEAVVHLVAFPPKPIYKMVDKNSDGNYQITWEAKGLVSIDSYSITYRERNSPSEWWQQEGPFEVSSPSSDDTYSHTFHNLQPYTDYEAIVSTIYQDMATTGDPFPFSAKRTGDMYPSSRKPGNGLVRAWMKQPVEKAKNQALELVCMMDTKRRTKVQWFHGHDQEVPIEDGERITSYQKGKKNILKFTSVEPSDLGEYRCQGHTPSGIKEATVQLVAFPPPANKQEITELNSGIYNLTWESKGLAPVTSFSITYRKSDSTSEGWHQIGPIQVKDGDNNGDKYSYEFTNLQPSSSYDVIVSTIYSDLATTGEPFSFTTRDASPSVIAQSVIAPINFADLNNMGKVRVWIEQPVVQVDIGTSSQLVCVGDEQQDMQFDWYHGQQKVVTDEHRFIRREDNRIIIQFTSISSKDLGIYQCIAYNKFGRATAFGKLTTTADDVSITLPRGVLKSDDVTQWWSLTQAIFSDVHKYLKTLTRIPQPTELVY